MIPTLTTRMGVTEHNVVSHVGMGHILREGAAIFTDMTETMLTALDKQMALSDTAQKPEGSDPWTSI